jgi:predicted dehydrogenase
LGPASTAPIRLALIGAGIYARDEHLPAIQRLGEAFEIVAIFSRTQANAAALAAHLPYPVNLYTDLDPLLARDDIEAVDILLPIDAMPAVVEQALASGKHVVSEKPIAPDVATGRRLMQAQRGQVWMVAENWRYEDAFQQTAQIVRSGEIGRPLLCHWPLHVPMTPANKYYVTEWRRSGAFPGGFLLDGGVHHVAAMRLVLGDIREVSAFVTQMHDDLPPADTLSATFRFDSGLLGAYSVTYTTAAPWPSALHIAGEQGAIRVHRGELQVTQNGATSSLKVMPGKGVEWELAAFAAAIRRGAAHANTPEAALQDVAVVEAMLRAADTRRAVQPERT